MFLHWEAARCFSWRHLAFLSSHVDCRSRLHLPLKSPTRMSCPGCLIGMLKGRAIPTERQTESYTRDKKEFAAAIFCKAHPSHLWKCFPIPPGSQQALHSCGLRRLSGLPRYWEIRWSSRSSRAIGANQGEWEKLAMSIWLCCKRSLQQLLQRCPFAAALG